MNILHLPVQRLTSEPKHHFFGYFDKFPWDKNGKRILAHQTDFTARQPKPGEKAVVGVIENEIFQPVSTTDAWCWQQGSMLQWLPDSENKIIFNDREGDSFVSRILDLSTGRSETVCRPIYCLSPDGRWALSVNFSRLDRERPGYGYPGGHDPFLGHHPDDDGIWLVDLKANTARLIISLDQVTREYLRTGENGMEGVAGWFNHLLFSPDSRRIAFFHRWRIYRPNGAPFYITHMFTANIDGSELYPLNIEDMSSHYVWVNNRQIINFSNRHATGHNYHLFTDQTDQVEVIAKGVFAGNGHCSYSSDSRWMLTDSYPLAEDSCRRLYLYRLADGEAFEIGSFYADPNYPAPTRCDLHPNWSRDDSKVLIDSIHEGSRQIYMIDVSSLTKA